MQITIKCQDDTGDIDLCVSNEELNNNNYVELVFKKGDDYSEICVPVLEVFEALNTFIALRQRELDDEIGESPNVY